jgi:hypothetical protein
MHISLNDVQYELIPGIIHETHKRISKSIPQSHRDEGLNPVLTMSTNLMYTIL